MESWVLLTCFFSCFLSATIIPFPSEATVLFCLTQGFNPYAVLLVATVGNSLGGSTNYFLGILTRKRWLKNPHPKAQHLVNRFGVYAAWLAWVPIIGDPIMLLLGYYGTKKIPTFLFMTLGKFIRYVIFVIPFI